MSEFLKNDQEKLIEKLDNMQIDGITDKIEDFFWNNRKNLLCFVIIFLIYKFK